MSATYWHRHDLYLGRVIIAQISPNWTPGPNGEKWAGLIRLPGARAVIGPFINEATAREKIMEAAQSRIKAMFGAGIETTATAVREGRSLRTVSRAIYRAGVWRCDQPVNAHAMFEDLGRALGFKPEDAPLPNKDAMASEALGSSAEPVPDPVDMIEAA